MGTKTITIMDDAYELLKQEKAANESFSDVIRKVIPKKKSIWDFVGALKDLGEEEAENLRRTVNEVRYKSSEVRRKKILELVKDEVS
jgi:predicted CopG family antitoxin